MDPATGPPPRDLHAGRAREANAGRNSMRDVPHWMRDDGLAVRKRLRKWPVDADGWVRVLVAPPRAYVAQSAASFAAGCASCCAAGSAAGRHEDARRCARLGAGCALAARCDAAVEHALMRRAKFFVAAPPAGRLSGEFPAMS
ncbi:hypothetical protein F511_47073 [Dorcoceras hygrometricum]|uniref:Uncharacterized protein n=1 Tax=Dorcoceras hygrometricum TaxID=472368 RepID=A0A2Z6ZRY2_9LAMI|nr:hypothetical protein F511_47073 [Dorcoceras hygrometricum]